MTDNSEVQQCLEDLLPRISTEYGTPLEVLREKVTLAATQDPEIFKERVLSTLEYGVEIKRKQRQDERKAELVLALTELEQRLTVPNLKAVLTLMPEPWLELYGVVVSRRVMREAVRIKGCTVDVDTMVRVRWHGGRGGLNLKSQRVELILESVLVVKRVEVFDPFALIMSF